MKDTLKKKREEYVGQYNAVANNINALRQRLDQEAQHLEQLRGAVAALDQLEQSLNADAPKAPESAPAPAAAEATPAAAPAAESGEKGASDGQAQA